MWVQRYNFFLNLQIFIKKIIKILFFVAYRGIEPLLQE